MFETTLLGNNRPGVLTRIYLAINPMHFARTVLCSPGLSVSGIWWKGQIDESCPGKEFLGETRAKIQPEWPPCWCSRDLHHQLFFPRLLCDGVQRAFLNGVPGEQSTGRKGRGQTFVGKTHL